MNPKIIGTFTFHDEEELLVTQIEILSALCDEIVIQGDNPTEKAKEIALSYADKKRVFYIQNTKHDNFKQRDEFGDRQRLLNFAKERNCEVHVHTDVDEFFALKDLTKVLEIINNCKFDEIYTFCRYDFWGNAFNYRIPYNTNQHASKIISGYKPNQNYSYVYHAKYALGFDSKPTPNFHCPRIPYFSNRMTNVLRDDISVYHMGYYLHSKIKKKGEFYNQNPNVSGNCWGEDMRVSRDEFLHKWGMGELVRKL